MKIILDYLAATPIFAIFLSLALGYVLARIKIGPVTLGATIGTLLVSFILSRFVTFSIDGILVNVFSLLFCFTLGYEAGPSFFRSLVSNGVKYVLHTVFFCLSAFAFLVLLGKLGIVEESVIIGIAAGALTQTSILTVADNSSIAYAVTYIFGTVLAILFASVIAPRLLGTDLATAVRNNIKRNGRSTVSDAEDYVRVSSVSMRAYRIDEGSKYVGKSIEELEDDYEHVLEIERMFRNGEELKFDQSTVIAPGDIISVIGSARQFIRIDDHLTEIDDSKYTEAEVVNRDVILAEDFKGNIVDALSAHGVILRKVRVNMRNIPVTEEMVLKKGTILKVSGLKTAVAKAADSLGYIRENGDITDVPFVFAALALGVFLGSLSFWGFSFGGSTCALITGLVCGWYSNRNPKLGAFPSGTRWFLKSVGLNLFIAVKGLTTGTFELDKTLLIMIGLGIAVTLVPHVLSLFFAKLVLKMDDADIMGCQCGSGTCTAALNALLDRSGSTVFVTSFATSNAVSNILLTVVGILVASAL